MRHSHAPFTCALLTIHGPSLIIATPYSQYTYLLAIKERFTLGAEILEDIAAQTQR
jgi:hypothetical protein